METRSLMTRSAIVLEMVIFPSAALAGFRCFTTIGTSLLSGSSWSIRKPRSAGMWSNTMSITCWSTSSTGRTAIRVSATLVRTFRMRLLFSISWTSRALFLTSAGGDRRAAPVSARSLRQLADAADDRARLFGEGLGLVEDDLALEGLAEGDLELAEQDLVAVLEGRLHHRHAVDLGAVLGLEVGDADPVLVRRRCGRGVREMPKSLRTIWHSGERPISTSPLVKRVRLRGVAVLVEQAIHAVRGRAMPDPSTPFLRVLLPFEAPQHQLVHRRTRRLALVEHRPHLRARSASRCPLARRARRRRGWCARPRPPWRPRRAPPRAARPRPGPGPGGGCGRGRRCR